MAWAPAPRPGRPRALSRDLAHLDAATRARADELQRLHPAIADWSRWLSPPEVQEGLYLLAVLGPLIPDDLRPAGAVARALDVGSKNGVHLPALHALVPVPWTLVELDAHRRYANLATRRSRGEAIAAGHAGCRYVADSIRALLPETERFDVITWTLPFVFRKPLAAWGLPDRFFEPAPLLAHVLSLLSARGALLIVNQGERERDEQRRLFDEVGVPPARIDVARAIESPLSPFRRPRFAFRVRGTERASTRS